LNRVYRTLAASQSACVLRLSCSSRPFIKQGQAHDLTLREIRDLLSGQSDDGRTRCRYVRDLLARKLTEMEGRRSDAFCDTFRDYLRLCDQALQSRTFTDCPVVKNLKAAKAR